MKKAVARKIFTEFQPLEAAPERVKCVYKRWKMRRVLGV